MTRQQAEVFELISTHALREEGDRTPRPNGRPHEISTHALREEGDHCLTGDALVDTTISTHALREEGDRRAKELVPFCGISTHALREEGDTSLSQDSSFFRISTHALREEGGRACMLAQQLKRPFLPTPSARRATVQLQAAIQTASGISTHALREEGDPDLQRQYQAAAISTHALREEGDSRSSRRPCWQ